MIILLGYGLVALPKDVWKLSEYGYQISKYEWKASDTKENMDEYGHELSKIKSKIRFFKSLTNNNLKNQFILDKIEEEVISNIKFKLVTVRTYPDQDQEYKKKKNVEYDELIELHKNVMVYRNEIKRCEQY